VDTDADDVARLRRGDIAGLAGLMERYQDRLFRYLARLLGEEAVAEDVFQQTWLRAAQRISRFDAARPFGPWLFAVARNLALDELRRRRPESLDETAGEPAAPVTPDADPLSRAVARQRRGRVVEAMAALAPLDREVLSLRFDEDLALPQIAARQGVPLPTAKARLYRALGRLRERLLARAGAEEWR
jgi:RNA polymerase sigma-70 factor (ECF subfamily)